MGSEMCIRDRENRDSSSKILLATIFGFDALMKNLLYDQFYFLNLSPLKFSSVNSLFHLYLLVLHEPTYVANSSSLNIGLTGDSISAKIQLFCWDKIFL